MDKVGVMPIAISVFGRISTHLPTWLKNGASVGVEHLLKSALQEFPAGFLNEDH